MIASLVYDGDVAVVNTPFRKDFVEYLKASIPHEYRAWDAERKVWRVSPPYGPTAARVVKMYYAGAMIDPPPGPKFREDPDPVWPRYQPASCGCSEAHRTLGVCATAPKEVIAAAYKALSKRLHPDAGGSDAEMLKLNAAYEQVIEEVRS